jgi:hypothetical protein
MQAPRSNISEHQENKINQNVTNTNKKQQVIHLVHHLANQVQIATKHSKPRQVITYSLSPLQNDKI